MKTNLIASIALALLASSTTGLAATITWGASGQPAGDFDVFSNADPINTPGFTYELGVFDPAFSPTEQNVTVWEENWIAVDTSPLDPATGAYGNTIDSTLFAGIPEGSQVYVWGFNSKTLMPAPEWVLFTGTTPSATNPGAPVSTDWLSPDGSSSQANFSLDFEAQTADTAVVGRIPGSGDKPGDFGGEISNPAPLGVNTIQTALIPEPSSSGLLLLGALGLLARRQR